MDTIAKDWTISRNCSRRAPKPAARRRQPRNLADFDDFDAKGKKMAPMPPKLLRQPQRVPDAFKVAFGEVTKNCKGCHEAYRIKK